MRLGEVSRVTRETNVYVKLNLDSEGSVKITTGIPFLNSMLKIFTKYSLMEITVRATGDLLHHIVEDVAISLGSCINKALDKKIGINRFGYASVPVNSSLVFAAIDLADRPFVKIDLNLKDDSVNNLPCEDIIHFFESLANSLHANVHIWTEYGSKDRDKIEGAFKAFAISLKEAIALDPRRSGVPSSKGVL